MKTLKIKSQNNRPLTSLNFAGGGFLAITSLKILIELEKMFLESLRKRFPEFQFENESPNYFPFHKLFDLISGTSTGSIVAAALRKDLRPEEILSLYLKHGRSIFPGTLKRFWNKYISRGIFSAQGFSSPKYSSEPLIDLLRETLGTITLSELNENGKLMIVAVDFEASDTLHFKSWKNEFANLAVWEAVVSSCSADTFLPIHEIHYKDKEMFLVDGGTSGANDPSLHAIVELFKISKTSDMLIGSISTGQKSRKLSGKKAKHWGSVQLVSNGILPRELLLRPEKSARRVGAYLVNEQELENFYSFGTPAVFNSDEMDDASESQVQAMFEDVNIYLNQPATKAYMNSFVNRLLSLLE
ncbi:patatin-like phospholipase family protein [Leptospira idonii]|uniref:PNPLA domain-containing protein n=1 Tax=Leptospira idonii TaxID=1193500 RepID=A0A4V3JYE0_9LEPT|nr:patatin-like phospholipase family protein [Leptospira idonii]TGN20806.1 hypothetical protein EHS15_01855 [Leptospira idonii]